METRVFSPTAYTFGEQRPRPEETMKGRKRQICINKEENPFLKARNGSEKHVKSKVGNDSANGSVEKAWSKCKKRTKRTSINS